MGSLNLGLSGRMIEYSVVEQNDLPFWGRRMGTD